MDRRDFLKTQAKGALLLSVGASGLFLPEPGIAATEPDIAKVKGAPAAATRAAVELLGGIQKFVKPGDRVVIKPNMSFNRSPEQASNTHPEVVRELAVMCKEAQAAKVFILDHTLASPKMCLLRSGIEEACKSVDPNMVYTINESNLYQDVPIPRAVNLNQTQLIKEVLKADVLIAAPVAKSHSATGVSLSMKGMMGLIWDRWIMHRQGLDETIVDLCTVLKADLTVIDGSRVLSTNGPHGPGKVLRENTIIASRDMVAADACAVESFTWYGRKYKAKQVGHIREAHRRKFGRMDIDNLTIKTVTI
ncbi:MAG: DUF362 domain-containing protein [Deltaproteobacteria bacterium]|nr:DUF362 domain-containing protein [Deltaproteobacteria bacterium]MBT6614199.1 DUF362 domain-containing protein [Deltaproteobacteria bacterium]MBT7715299.1 DUF362 domain-containing protein [Deltaproteobacteria bacterium]